jgi:RimJ/RimL family protein N-acetyltransferase
VRLNVRVARRQTFELVTARLTVRMLTRRDITDFTRYRNIAAVAKYQDWRLPYTRDLAHDLVDDLDRLTGPTNGGWVQLALDATGDLIGDIAVWLDDGGDFAVVGYTLAPEHQRRGYAVEGLTAVIDWLFGRKRVHRIGATIDPRNLASARVLERCGFEYVGTARSAALVRGEWSDDARFSLLADGWRRWRRRPTDPPRDVELRPVTNDNVRQVTALDRTFSQRDLVAPVSASLAEALVPPVVRGETVQPWFRAIEADGELAGFVMLAEPYDGSPHPYLWRLVVDHHHQGRGIGRRAVLEIADARRRAGASRLTVRYVPDAVGSPEPFYRALGFEPTGRVHDGEVEAALDLTRLDG